MNQIHLTVNIFFSTHVTAIFKYKYSPYVIIEFFLRVCEAKNYYLNLAVSNRKYELKNIYPQKNNSCSIGIKEGDFHPIKKTDFLCNMIHTPPCFFYYITIKKSNPYYVTESDLENNFGVILVSNISKIIY